MDFESLLGPADLAMLNRHINLMVQLSALPVPPRVLQLAMIVAQGCSLLYIYGQVVDRTEQGRQYFQRRFDEIQEVEGMVFEMMRAHFGV